MDPHQMVKLWLKDSNDSRAIKFDYVEHDNYWLGYATIHNDGVVSCEKVDTSKLIGTSLNCRKVAHYLLGCKIIIYLNPRMRITSQLDFYHSNYADRLFKLWFKRVNNTKITYTYSKPVGFSGKPYWISTATINFNGKIELLRMDTSSLVDTKYNTKMDAGLLLANKVNIFIAENLPQDSWEKDLAANMAAWMKSS